MDECLTRLGWEREDSITLLMSFAKKRVNVR
jgi:hypothetical protein